MNTEKTPEQLMEELRNGIIWIDKTPTPPDYHQMALLAAQTLPNQSIGELLQNAEKIERWLMAPELERQEMSRQLREAINGWGIEQKSPEKLTPEAFDGVSGD